uniref:NADPH cytochrome P450 reductase-5 n=1 Tax=Morus alba var. multicaulis TaxID=170012 RepID=A0A8F2JDI7_MORAL|nr:NADPH cytochrome P450 reductase-5 [Morus alba var. multicaulis]
MDDPSPSSSSPSQSLESFLHLQSSACVPTEVPNNAVTEGNAAAAAAIPDISDPIVGNPPPFAGPTEENPDIPVKKGKKKTGKRVLKESSATASSSSPSLGPYQRGARVARKRRNARVAFGPARRNPVADSISFRLGMSIAAFVAQILENKDALGERMSADHLALICASAVRESLVNDFGDTFDSFVSNFEKSFRSTFRTLKLIQESTIIKRDDCLNHLNVKQSISGVAHDFGDCVFRGNASSSGIEICHSEELFHPNATEDLRSHSAAVEQSEVTDSASLELALYGQKNELAFVSRSPFESVNNRPMLSTMEKSVIEQTRSNDLKIVELGIAMKNLKLKETQLALNFDSNNLERSKLAMGASKASFKAEKFKTQLEDVRYAELRKRCIDCLVAGLLLMAASLLYGAYVFSYQKITEVTASCTPSSKESKSWWIPKPMASINSGIEILSCQFQVLIRRLFGFLMILSIAYLIIQRSSSSRETMPITFIVLFLALFCGLAGKVCVNTWGGSGYLWLLYWETLCLLHLICNVWTSVSFSILHGPLTVSPGMKHNARLPYWIRRVMFYGILFFFLPLLCGLHPFATLGEWKGHFLSRLFDYLSVMED